MLALLGLVVSIALADSLNPSTLAPALYYASTPRPRSTLTAFALGVLAVSLAGGVVVLLGGRELVRSLLPHLGARAEHGLEVAGGVVLLSVAAAVWRMRARVAASAARPRPTRPWSCFAVGAGIMAVELPTALPYFAVIGAVAASRSSIPAQLALVAVYNVLFVLPLAAILAIRTLTGPKGERLLLALRDWTQRNAAAVLAGTLALVGAVCLAVGIGGLV